MSTLFFSRHTHSEKKEGKSIYCRKKTIFNYWGLFSMMYVSQKIVATVWLHKVLVACRWKNYEIETFIQPGGQSTLTSLL
jgi:hypothetical protein